MCKKDTNKTVFTWINKQKKVNQLTILKNADILCFVQVWRTSTETVYNNMMQHSYLWKELYMEHPNYNATLSAPFEQEKALNQKTALMWQIFPPCLKEHLTFVKKKLMGELCMRICTHKGKIRTLTHAAAADASSWWSGCSQGVDDADLGAVK